MLIQIYRKVSPVLEYCYNIEISGTLTEEEMRILLWLLAETFEPLGCGALPFLINLYPDLSDHRIVEIGPRMNFATAWNTNALSILHACGITKVSRIERSRRYLLPKSMSDDELIRYITEHCKYDRMTEMIYEKPLTTYETGIIPEDPFEIPLIEKGPEVLADYGIKDPEEQKYYHWYFTEHEKRNPTNVEIKDLGGSNSEHSRHGYFKGIQIIDGVEMPETLMEIVQSTLTKPNNSIIAFSDNSSGIYGYAIETIVPENPGKPSRFIRGKFLYHPILTAETHNFPSGVAPFPGAETGTGGRIRDVHATGRGASPIAGAAAYCVGNLYIPGYDLPWEDKTFVYPKTLASPLRILIDASNGASDYGNKFGEPVILGFARSFGIRLANGERREWIKPIMYTAGIGQIPDWNVKKDEPKAGMKIVRIGGPAYNIGLGGAPASSLLQGEQAEKLDYDAVQRGDAEMEQKVNRAIRACIELGILNSIRSIHDQGALGPANVLKELVEKAGGRIEIRKINLGDKTLSVLVIWVAEYQEGIGILIDPDRIDEFIEICDREKVPYEILGEVTSDGRFVVYDSNNDSTPVNFDLNLVLGNLPQKTFFDKHIPAYRKALEFPKKLIIHDALERVLRLVSVGSKRFLTNKVDRSVTGLIVQQQCAGPLQLPLSNVAVVAQSHFGLTGAAKAIGERPLIGLIDPKAQGRMTTAEMLTNMVWARISRIEDIKCSGNWMWAPKLPGEGAKLYDAASAMRDLMIELIGTAVDGGKDSLSMATIIKETGELVKSPGQLVICGYCTMPDIRKVITPNIKRPGESLLVYFDLSGLKQRLGGSALAHVFGQIGDECPDVDNPEELKLTYNAIQEAIDAGLILSGHDRSDGGLVTTLLEMAFAGNCGFSLGYLTDLENPLAFLFNEELGLVLELGFEEYSKFIDILQKYRLHFHAKMLGYTQVEKKVKISYYDSAKKEDIIVLNEDMCVLRQIWEETSYQLERLQCKPECAEEEKRNIFDRPGIKYHVNFDYGETPQEIIDRKVKPKVAIIREEGSNGDREMTSAFYLAGFEVWDVTMTDLLEGKAYLADFRGVAFVGGFSYADVLDSAKGWAGVIRFNEKLRTMFDKFYDRTDTFSLGVCNGCQLMALLGWVPFEKARDSVQPRFICNLSERFESRFSMIKILPSPAMMLQGMENSVLGAWVAHGEGRFHAPYSESIELIERDGLAPIRFVDDESQITEDYPYNPNRSPLGITSLCSPDGRHLAMMPHPERSFLKWQWPYKPDGWKEDKDQASPWLRMFQNAREWCDRNTKNEK